MCGIAGIVDLTGQHPVPGEAVRAMADASTTAAPTRTATSINRVSAWRRRLSIVGLADGRQPISNEDGSVSVVYNGELFDYPEAAANWKAAAIASAPTPIPNCCPITGRTTRRDVRAVARPVRRGPVGRTPAPAGPRPRPLRHLPAVLDAHQRHGGDWLLFASEIKALLASGMVEARADLRGINHVFTFFALPGPVTCFQGVAALPPGHYLRMQLGGPGGAASQRTRYWEIDFPDRGDERTGSEQQLVGCFESSDARGDGASGCGPTCRWCRICRAASIPAPWSPWPATSAASRSPPSPSASRIPSSTRPSEANVVARHLSASRSSSIAAPRRCCPPIRRSSAAAEYPVVDTSCAALLLLAREVHRQGYKVALTGEGADEWLAGYPWYKVSKLLGYLDFIPVCS